MKLLLYQGVRNDRVKLCHLHLNKAFALYGDSEQQIIELHINIFSTSFAISNEDVNPGDSIPIKFTKPANPFPLSS